MIFSAFVSIVLVALKLFVPVEISSQVGNQALASQSTADREREVWASLSPQARRIILERSRYIYRFDNDVYVDAYDMLYWHEESRKNIVTRRTQRSRGNFSRPITLSETVVYERDPELEAYFSIGGYPCIFWIDGVVANRSDLWHTPAYLNFRSGLGVADRDPKEMASRIKQELRRMLPIVCAVSPLDHAKGSDRIYSASSGRTIFRAVLVGDFSASHNTMSFAVRYKDQGLPHRGGQAFFLQPSRNVKDGRPIASLQTFGLLPHARGPVAAIAPPTRPQDEEIEYEVVDLRRYRLTPKEVAVAFVDGKLEIPIREVSNESGIWTCRETLLARP